MRIYKNILISFALISSAFAAEPIGPLELLPSTTAGSQGILLSDVVTNRTGEPLPRIQLGPAPAIGRPVFLNRSQVATLLTKAAPELVCSNWLGAERIKIARATRVVNDAMLKDLLTDTLQSEQVKDRGELELRFNRPWNPLVVPDEPISIKVVELPTSGVSPNFICRFELKTGDEVVGTYQQPLS